MSNSDLDPFEGLEALGQIFSDRDGPMPPSRAPDRNREVRLPFRDVMRHQKSQVIARQSHETLRRTGAEDVGGHSRVPTAPATERPDEMRIRKESDVEDEVSVLRHAVAKSEAQQRHSQRSDALGSAHGLEDPAPEFVNGQRARVEHLIGNSSNRLEQPAFLEQPFGDCSIVPEWMWTPRLAEPPEQRALASIEKHEAHLVRSRALLEATIGGRKAGQRSSFADVDHDGGSPHATRRPQRQIGKGWDERDRQVVDAEESEVFESTDGVRLSRPRQSRDDNEVGRAP